MQTFCGQSGRLTGIELGALVRARRFALTGADQGANKRWGLPADREITPGT